LLAKSVAGDASASFFVVSVPDLIKGEVGESEKAVSNLFRQARRNAPAIIFIDEVDALFSANRNINEYSSKVFFN
jgi:transitional endoplasmic reticulum ATPase